MIYALLVPILIVMLSSSVYGMNAIVQDTDLQFNSGDLSQIQVRNQGAAAQLELPFAFQPLTVGAPWPPPRKWQGAAYDTSRGAVLLFGGLGDNIDDMRDTWKFVPATGRWSSLYVSTSPAVRYGHIMAASGDGKIVLFGGRDVSANYYNDTWVYSFAINDWYEQPTSSAPSKRSYMAAATDPATKKIVLFGGKDQAEGRLGDTWVYDIANASWSYRNAAGPSARSGASMVYCSSDQKYYLFGGSDDSGKKQDLWKYDENANTWSPVAAGGTAPSRREDAGMVYDTKYSRIVVYGGIDSSGLYDDAVWYIDPANPNWYGGVPLNAPTARMAHSFLYLPDGDRAFLFAGFGADELQDVDYYVWRDTGTYKSATLDAYQSGDPGTSLRWMKMSMSPTSQLPSTTIRFQVAASTSPDEGSFSYGGPDGTAASYYTVPAYEFTLSTGLNDKRYVRYRAELSSTRPPNTPKIDKVVVAYDFAPRIPVLASPLHGGSTNYRLPLFTWNNTTDPDNTLVFNDTITYQIQVDSSSGFATPPVDITALSSAAGTTSSYASTTTLAQGLWYWRVRANDAYLNGSWSAPFTLYVDTTPPAAVTDLSATIGALNGQITLSWTVPGDINPDPMASSLNYSVRYATYGPITQAIYDSLASTERKGTTVAVPGARITIGVGSLSEATTYYFGLRVGDNAGNVSSLAATEGGAFTNAPPSVTLLQPSGGENWTGVHEIQWQPSDPNPGDTLLFDIYDSTDGGGRYSVPVATGLANGTTWYTWDTRRAINGAQHMLRITVTDFRGLSSSAATAGPFTVTNNDPLAVAISYPGEAATVSGTVAFSWRVADQEGEYAPSFTVSLSSTGGSSYFWQTVTAATYYVLNTAAFGNGPSYRVTVTATDAGSPPRTGQAAVNFVLDNNNRPPRPFSLLGPVNGSFRSPLDLVFQWENAGDPDGDPLAYTLSFSTSANFAGCITVTGITGSWYRVDPADFETGRTYYWKVTARDPLGLERQSNQTYWTVALSRFKAESDDGSISIEATGGMPLNGYLTVVKVRSSEFRALETAERETRANRQLCSLGEPAYRISIRDITGNEVSAPEISLSLGMRYPDPNDSGYYNGTNVPAANLRCAVLDADAGRWELTPALPVIDRQGKRLTSAIRSTGIVSLMGALAPLKKVSGVVNYPNPFAAGREETRVKYVLTEDRNVTASIYTLTGDLVWRRTYAAGLEGGKGQPSGYGNEIRWDGKNDNGMTVADGMYILELKAANDREIRKIGVVK